MIHVRSRKEYTVHQFCNDWINGDPVDDGPPKILNPVTVMVTGEELIQMRFDRNPGQFWNWYEAYAAGDGWRFKKVRT